MNAEMMTALVNEQVAAYNARDLVAFLGTYAPNVEVEGPDGALIASGHDGLRAIYGPLFANSPDLRCEIRARIQVGRFIIDEEWVTGAKLEGFPESAHAAVAYTIGDEMIERVKLFM
jgi:hypothetical protein